MADLLKRGGGGGLVVATAMLWLAFSLGQYAVPTHVTLPSLWNLFAGAPVQAIYRVSTIQQLQHVSIALTNVQSTNTATITAVVAANTALSFRGCTNADAGVTGDNIAYFTYTNTTTITLTRQNLGSRTAMTCEADIVEYVPGILKSVQRSVRSIAGAATTNVWTITAITIAKLYVSILGHAYAGATIVNQDVEVRPVITSTTVITSTRVGSAANVDISLEAVEFK